MRKKFLKIITLLLVCLFSVQSFACNNNDLGIDTTKTQLSVINYDAGFGHVYLDDLVKRFEKYYEETSLEEGKKGVQVHVYNTKPVAISSMKTDSHQVFITAEVYFNNYVASGDFLNLNDIVKERNLPGETRNIESKLNDVIKEGLTAVDGNYYALPTMQGYSGVTYNRYLFDQKGLYFADDVSECAIKDVEDPRYGFILKTNIKKSTGPDGLYGTDDDGLPSSIEEYKKLCDCMVFLNVTPFICFANSSHYTNHLLYGLWTNLAGYDQAMLNYSFNSQENGKATIVKTDSVNYPLYENGELCLEDVEITENNGYLLTKQAAKYYALDFMQYVFNAEDIGTYMDPRSLSASLSHTDAQLEFMRGMEVDKPIGMLIEGGYWYTESVDAGNFEFIKNNYPEYYENMDFRAMPLPVIYEGRVKPIGTVGEDGVTKADGNKQTVVDTNANYIVINANAVAENPAEKEAAKLFVQFMFTEESLQQSTMLGRLSWPYDYSLTEEQYQSLPTYVQSVYNIYKNENTIMPISDSSVFVKNQKKFTPITSGEPELWKTKDYSYTLTAFRAGKSLDSYFKSLVEYHDADWWGRLSK